MTSSSFPNCLFCQTPLTEKNLSDIVTADDNSKMHYVGEHLLDVYTCPKCQKNTYFDIKLKKSFENTYNNRL